MLLGLKLRLETESPGLGRICIPQANVNDSRFYSRNALFAVLLLHQNS